MEKIWIEGHEGRYSCTTEGKIYSHYKNGGVKEVGAQSGSGYIYVNLSKNGVKTSKLVHRIVAETFIPNPDDLPQVDHIDENKTNNGVDNLRWCTQQKNIEYYNTKDGRDHHLELNRQHKQKIVELLQEIQREKREVHRLTKIVTDMQENLETEKKRFEEYATKEHSKIIVAKENYQGYANITGVKFKNKQAMIEATGKQITVQGQRFPSCGAAAKWIVEQEASAGTSRNKDTISKELRRYIQGRRSEWIMYDRYNIGS